MASVINTRLISAVSESAIQMANSCFSRGVSFPSGWKTIRVGMRLHMSNTGGTLSSPTFAFGICSGSANIFGDSTVGHFLGAVSTGPWAFQTTFYNNTSFVAAKKVGSSLTQSAAFIQNAAVQCQAATNTADRGFMFIDITKGSPNYTLNLFYLANTSGHDESVAKFLLLMEISGSNVVSSSYAYSADQTIACNEAVDGTFDSINISWNTSTPFIEICDIAFARSA